MGATRLRVEPNANVPVAPAYVRFIKWLVFSMARGGEGGRGIEKSARSGERMDRVITI